jgi:Putative lumazine-binding
MRMHFGLRTLAMAAIVLLGPTVDAQESADESAVRQVIGTYFRGHATGQADTMRAAFLPTAHIEGLRNGAFVSWTVDQYVAGFRGQPAADESSRMRTIDVVDISGTGAMVRATLKHGATTFTDYFVLLKVDGNWRIANKVYHAQR